jgi:hypothetical protein
MGLLMSGHSALSLEIAAIIDQRNYLKPPVSRRGRNVRKTVILEGVCKDFFRSPQISDEKAGGGAFKLCTGRKNVDVDVCY